MQNHDSQSQLIFGILAVQLGFSKPEQVMSAAAAWMVDRQSSVARQLISKGIIDEQKASMLQAMVEEAIHANGNDPQSALESLGGQQIVEQTFSGSIVLKASGEINIEQESDDTKDMLESRVHVSNKKPLRQRYEIKSEIGRGGQARVMLAYDKQMEREVAWKEPRDRNMGSKTQGTDPSRTEAARVRFLREAIITGGLEHPNIVPVYELGYNEDGSPYYTMRLIKGKTLSARLSQCSDISERLKLLGSVWSLCNAVAFAHNRGIIHRDIKPDNVIVGEFGETVVLDWGLAKARDEKDRRGKILQGQMEALQQGSTAQTVEGSALGTPSYMSPEQAEGKIDEIDERSDIWGLGAVLYRVLTGKAPHTGVSPLEIVGKAIKDKVRPVAELAPQAPPELAAIAEKALCREKSDRYQSAQELAKDVEAFMGGQRVSAYNYGSWELFRRFASKHRVIIASVTTILIVIISSLVFVSLAYRNEAKALDQEQRSRLLAHLRLAQAYDSQARTLMLRQKQLSARIYAAASLLYNPANPKGPSWTPDYSNLHPEAWTVFIRARSLLDQTRHRLVLRLKRVLKTPGHVSSMSLSMDGKYLAAATPTKGITVWKASDLSRKWSVHGHDVITYTIDFFPDSRHLISGGLKPSIATWKLGQDDPMLTIDLPPPTIRAAIVSPDSKLIAAISRNKFISIFNSRSTRPVRDFKASDKRIWRLLFTRDGKGLITASEDTSVRLWEVKTGHEIWQAKGHTGRVYALALSPDGNEIASASTDRTVRLWNAETGETEGVIRDSADGFYAVAFSANGKYIAAGGVDTVVSLWDSETGSRRISVEGHRDSIEDIAFSPDGRWMYSSSDDGTVRVWQLDDQKRQQHLRQNATIYAMAASPDGKTIITGTSIGKIHRWDLAGHQGGVLGQKDLFNFDRSCSSVMFSNEGKMLAAVAGQRLKVWHSADDKEILEASYKRGLLNSIAFSPDGKFIAAGSSAKSVVIFSLSRQEIFHEITPIDTYVNSVAYSPDGTLLFVAESTPQITVWDTATWKKVGILDGHSMPVNTLSVIPRTKHLASGDKGGVIIIWDMEKKELLYKLKTQGAPVLYMIVSSDAHWLAATSADDTLRVWDLSKRQLVVSRYIQFGPGPIVFLDNNLSMASSSDREIELINIDTQVADKDPKVLLEAAQKDAGLELDGFRLVQIPSSP